MHSRERMCLQRPSHTFSSISSIESVKKIDDVGSDALILDCGPCKAGKNTECSNAGLWKPNLGATSRVIRKYGSCQRTKNVIWRVYFSIYSTWSIAQGIRHWISLSSPKIFGNAVENDGAAWTAGKAIFPMLSDSLKPNIPFAWLKVTHFWIRSTCL